MDESPVYLSKLKNRARNIGNKKARQMEDSLGQRQGAWDRPPSDDRVIVEIGKLIQEMPEDEFVAFLIDRLPALSRDSQRKLSMAFLRYYSEDDSE